MNPISHADVADAARSNELLRIAYLPPLPHPKLQVPAVLPKNFLRSCDKVYLDLGTNVGEKFDVLHLKRGFFKFAHWQDPFNLVFGDTALNRSDVCAVGFEPNHNLTTKLRRLARKLTVSGHRIFLFNAAVSVSSGQAQLFSDTDLNRFPFNSWGKTLVKYDGRMVGRPSATVPTISLTWFLQTHLLPQKARVLSKMDVEGAEYDILPAAWQIICRTIDHLMIERHDRFFRWSWRMRNKLQKTEVSADGQSKIKRLDIAISEMKADSSCRTGVSLMSHLEADKGADVVLVNRSVASAWYRVGVG